MRLKNAIEHFDPIFESCDQKLQNHGQKDCVDSCLISSHKFQNGLSTNYGGNKKIRNVKNGWMSKWAD